MEEGGAEAGESELLIIWSFGSDGADDGMAELLLGAVPEVGQDAGDQVFEGVRAAEDLRAG